MVGAKRIYTDLIKNNAYDEESMLEYGSILYQTGNIGEAIQVFIEVKKENKNSVRAISNLITLYREKKNSIKH